MSGPLKNLLFILTIILVPFLLGVLVVGGQPTFGRNSRSSTRVGHRAVYLLLEALDYRVRRFERGLETLPPERSVLWAIEPGPALFRERGRFARGLTRWLESGNAALVTLGPDPDRDAELDGEGGTFGAGAERAIEVAEELREEARARANPDDPDAAPSEFLPLQEGSDDPNDAWDPIHLTDFLGVPSVQQGRLPGGVKTVRALTGTLALALGEAPGLALTRPRTFYQTGEAKAGLETLVAVDGQALLLEMRVGDGLLLLLAEPRTFQNVALSREAHALLAVRIAERLTAHAGSRTIYFEEFSHGGREAATVLDLAVSTRARWAFLQLLLVIALWIVWASRRSRSVLPFEVVPRRSRDELVDAMASLFLRAGDIEGAANRLAILTKQRFTAKLPSVPEAELPRAIARLLALDPDEVATTLDRQVGRPDDLVAQAEALRRLRVQLDE